MTEEKLSQFRMNAKRMNEFIKNTPKKSTGEFGMSTHLHIDTV